METSGPPHASRLVHLQIWTGTLPRERLPPKF